MEAVLGQPLDTSGVELLRRSYEINVASFDNVQMKGLRLFRITHVESPSDFRVEYLVDCQLPTGAVPWQKEMNNFYNKTENLLKYKLSTPRPLVGRFYVIHNVCGLGWQRCRVVERHEELGACTVVLLDSALVLKAVYEDLNELHPKFAHYSAMGFRAFLVDVKPRRQSWSTEASSTFKKLVLGKIFHGVVTRKEREKLHPKIPQVNFKLGLILVERTQPECEPVPYTINAIFCLLNLAYSDGVGSGLALANGNDKRFEFEAMKKALLREDPTKEVAKLDPNFERNCPWVKAGMGAPLTLTEKALYMKEILKIRFKVDEVKDEGPGADRESTLSFYRKVGKSNKDEFTRNMETIPKEIRNCLGICFISHITSPSCFYLQTKQKLTQLQPLMRYIESIVDAGPEMTTNRIKMGLEVAVFMFDEFQDPCWYRGVIRQVFRDLKLARVILVDYGNEVTVKFQSMRNLPPYFCSIPGLAQRVHIDVRSLTPISKNVQSSSITWSAEAIDIFRKYLTIWQLENPRYYIWRPGGSSVVDLDFYGQELSYNLESRVWGTGTEGRFTKHPNPKYNTPLTKNLYSSIGIDIAYEYVTSSREAYKFEKAWDILVTQGHATVDEQASTFPASSQEKIS